MVASPITAQGIAQEFNFKSYVSETIPNASIQADSIGAVDFGYFPPHFKYRTNVFFTGNWRAIRGANAKFIEKWGLAQNRDPEFSKMFVHEIEVRQANVNYWMPIQASLEATFRAEAVPGAKVQIFILLMGKTKDTTIFSVAEFVAPERSFLYDDNFDFFLYKNKFISNVSKQFEDNKNKNEAVFTPDELIRCTVAFQGKIRKIDSGTIKFLNYWKVANSIDVNMEETFQYEAEFVEKNRSKIKKYWIPIQNQLFIPFKAEVKAGKLVQIFLRLMGGHNGKAILTLEEFKSDSNQFFSDFID